MVDLTYFTLDTDREIGGFHFYEHPESKQCFTSPEAAMAAGDAVFARVLSEYQEKLKAYDPVREMGDAKRAWEDPKRSACHIETRIKDSRIDWLDTTYRTRPERRGTLTILCECRHRWREVEMRTTIAKDGSTTITHALGKALPWTKWGSGRGIDQHGGVYVPQQVALIVRETTLRFAAERDAVVDWVTEGDHG